MLITYGQFELQQAVRSSAHLLHPRTVRQTHLKMPRGSMVHYLDLQSDAQFPSRELVQLQGIPENKRIPVFHVTDLRLKTEVQMLQDRYVDKRIRQWQRAHMRDFRAWELLEVPNPDPLTNSIINYNLLKHLYKYKSTLTSPLSRYVDVMTTYWQTIAQAIDKDPQSNHFATIAIPKALPSRAILNRLVEFSPTRYARVVTNPELNGIIQLYKYLNPQWRETSTMAAITDAACAHLTIEFTYEGYSVFCKLSYLVSLLKDSPLPSKVKLPIERLQQLFLLMLLKIQNTVEDKLQGTDPELLEEDTLDAEPNPLSPAEPLTEDDTDPKLQDNPPIDLDAALPASPTRTRSASKEPALLPELSLNTLFSEDTQDDAQFSALLEAGLKEYEGVSDDLFVKALSTATAPLESQEDTPDAQEPPSLVDVHQVDYSEENLTRLLKAPSAQERFEAYIQEAKSFDAISTAEARSLRKVFEKRQTLKSPYKDQVIDAYQQVTPQDLTLPETKLPIVNDLVEDSLKEELLFNLDKKYTQGPMRKHLVACVTSLERNDIILKDYQVEEVTSSIGKYEVHKLTLKPLRGKESPVYFRIPVINDEGEFTVGGIKYRLRRQKTSSCLCKISPTKVGISSNYNKLFVFRTERKAFDPYSQIVDQIKTDYLDGKGNITKIAPGNRYKNTLKLPNIYSALSQSFNDIQTPTHHFFFNHDEIATRLDAAVVQALQKDNLLFIGHDTQAHILVIDAQEQIYDYSDNKAPLGRIEELLQLNTAKLPQAFSAIKILGDTIPLGVMLGYYLGLKNLVAVTRSEMQVHPPRKQVARPPRGVILSFSDARVVITCPTHSAELLFAGYLFYKDHLKTQLLESLYSPNVYLDVLESRDASLMHLKEMDMLKDNFIDPITRDVLSAAGEPTEFIPLMLRANQMLEDFHHPDVNDPALSRIRGYDRLPGLVYRALTESVRTHKLKGGKGKIELDPYKVWKYVTQDTTVKITEDNNPITDTKEVESATFSGMDGLSRTATPEKLRRFHAKDAGLISEATVDSSDVALNIYLSPYAKLKSLLGDVDSDSTAHESDPSKIFSTSVQLLPFAEYDD